MSGSGIRRSKEFLRSLSPEEMKKIKVEIRRNNIPEPKENMIIHRGLTDPKNLVIHFKKETLRGIFARDDIVLNQEIEEDSLKINSRDCNRRSSSSEDRRSSSSEDRRSQESSNRDRNKRERSYRSRSRSGGRCKSRSGSYRKISKTPSRDRHNARLHSVERRRSKSLSPHSSPKKKPGLFIPTESDYLKLEKRKVHRSRSPIVSSSTKKDMEQHSSTESNYLKLEKRKAHRSRSPVASSSTKKDREQHSSTDRYRSSHRTNRSQSTSRRRRSRSPRYRSRQRSRSRDFERKNIYDPEGIPYIFQKGQYFLPAGTNMLRPGFMPHPMFPRPFLPHMMMPPMPNMMQPFRQRLPRPRHQSTVVDVTPTTSSNTVQISEVGDDTGQRKPQDM